MCNCNNNLVHKNKVTIIFKKLWETSQFDNKNIIIKKNK